MSITHTIGRRKTSVARIYVKAGTGTIVVNEKALDVFFPLATIQQEVVKPFLITNTMGQFDVTVNVQGGGITGQAGAIRLAISRALDVINPELHAALKAESLFTRDPRMVERKKFGHKKARKRFQFSKR